MRTLYNEYMDYCETQIASDEALDCWFCFGPHRSTECAPELIGEIEKDRRAAFHKLDAIHRENAGKPKFKVGDNVAITAGPLRDHDGEVCNVYYTQTVTQSHC